MSYEEWLHVRLVRVATACIVGAAAVKLMFPHERVHEAVLAALVAVFVQRGQYRDAGLNALVVIQLVESPPAIRQEISCLLYTSRCV